MKNESRQPTFSTAMLTGVFVGFVVTIVCLIYNLIFRNSTDFTPSELINVSSLIFGVNIAFLVIGVVYALLLQKFEKADGIFDVLFILIMAFLFWKGAGVHRVQDLVQNREFRELLEGILVISAIGIFLIPFLSRHRKFLDAVI